MNDCYQIHLLEAKTGDSFIVECGDSSFIVDGGTRSVAKDLKRYLKEQSHCNLKAIFVTHIDRDHVGGIVKLFTHFRTYVPQTVCVYVNHPSLVSAKNDKTGLVTYEDGDNLKKILDEHHYHVEQAISKKNIIFNDVEISVLSPDKILRDDLYKDWKGNDNVDEGLVSNDIIEVDCSLTPNDSAVSTRGDIVNASSMSFIISYQGKRALFLSDSLPSNIAQALEVTNKFDIVKVSHHGSKYNTNIELLDKIDCNNFIFSTNGPRSYGHPHSETIVKIINSCIKHGYNECNLFFNYKKVSDRVRVFNTPKYFNVNIKYSKVIKL
ncbi:ComEC/Rec2 family competence protein [Photobacterium leiognathi]|uniref:ComEC/Rec2 family competence protein n=1 Tax=Photobacterium leiognathi TaxID=553611 RepID=UPI002980FD0C|nr:MBL fold metallo-hydrolase [Photobacterium leiognathi]